MPHYLAEVYVDGRWVTADATFDRALLPDAEDWEAKKMSAQFKMKQTCRT